MEPVNEDAPAATEPKAAHINLVYRLVHLVELEFATLGKDISAEIAAIKAKL